MYCYDITDAQVVHPSGILINLITLYQRAGTVQVVVSHTRTQFTAAIVQSTLTISTHRHPPRGCNTLPIQSFSDLEDWWGRVQQKVHGRLNWRRPPNSQPPLPHHLETTLPNRLGPLPHPTRPHPNPPAQKFENGEFEGTRPVFYLLGNKIDLKAQRQVPEKAHANWIREKELGGGFFVSARSGEKRNFTHLPGTGILSSPAPTIPTIAPSSSPNLIPMPSPWPSPKARMSSRSSSPWRPKAWGWS